ncbi:RHS repeat protein [Streptacidiphilus sp. EB103A]|uniref:RHS repeat protein n=1 Tax=Streptacidiphilus sp. EB103A TaxID=3156275 RepID=UPI0035157267
MPIPRDDDRRAVRHFPVGAATTLTVELATGELVLYQQDLVIHQAGRELRLGREHRGRREEAADSDHPVQGSFGAGWMLSADPAFSVGPSALIDPRGRVIALQRDHRGLVTVIVDPLGARAAELGYDAGGRPVRHRDATGQHTGFSWDDDGRLTGITDAAGGVVTLSYDSSGAVSRVVRSSQGRLSHTAFSYRPGSTAVTDAAGRTTEYGFDKRGLPVSETDPLGQVRRQEWDPAGLLVAVTDATGHRTAYEYDVAERLVALRLPTSARSTAEYADPANPRLPTVLRDPAGRELRLVYDRQGRLIRTGAAGRDGDLDRRDYHPCHGRLSAFTDGNGHTTVFAYDEYGDLIGVTPPQPLGRTSYRYDGLSRVTGVTSGNGRRTSYRRDPAGRLAEVTDEDSGEVLLTLIRDPLGKVVRKAGPGWSYDFSWTDSARGSRLEAAVRTERGEREEVRCGYDAEGALTSLTTAGGITRYGYDAAGRTASVTAPSGQTARLAHDAAGRPTTIELGVATQTMTYDAAGRRTSLTVHGPGGEVLLSVGYDYRTDGADSDVLCTTVADGQSTDYAYDGLKRLVRAGDTEYAYDAAQHLVRLGSVRFVLGAAGEVTRFGETTFEYDGAGNFVEETNPTGSFRYSATNQTLTGVFGGATVVDVGYDGLGQEAPRRITETALDGRTVTHVLTYGPLGVTRVVDDGVPTDAVRTPDGTLLAVVTADGQHFWTVTDQQGSVLALIDEFGHPAARYRYTPHGAVTASGPAAAANPFRYRGAYQLLRSAHVLDHHLYNGFWGRFTQPDPTGQQYAPYTFSDNDPLNSGTPTRHDFWSVLVHAPEEAVERFFPHPRSQLRPPPQPVTFDLTAPGLAPDRRPLIAEPRNRTIRSH